MIQIFDLILDFTKETYPKFQDRVYQCKVDVDYSRSQIGFQPISERKKKTLGCNIIY